jgi:hypothetical protein
MKECRSCKEKKSENEFYIRLSNSDGLYSYCKICTLSKSKDKYERRKSFYAESGKRYREKNLMSIRKRSRDYYYRNKEDCLKKRSDYRKENREKISIREATNRINDPDRFEKNRERQFEWSSKNRDRLNEYQRQWYQKNKEKRRAHVTLNRAIASGKLMRPENCSECGKECKPDGHHEDYSKPLDVKWICRACHSRKSPRTVIR